MASISLATKGTGVCVPSRVKLAGVGRSLFLCLWPPTVTHSHTHWSTNTQTCTMHWSTSTYLVSFLFCPFLIFFSFLYFSWIIQRNHCIANSNRPFPVLTENREKGMAFKKTLLGGRGGQTERGEQISQTVQKERIWLLLSERGRTDKHSTL